MSKDTARASPTGNVPVGWDVGRTFGRKLATSSYHPNGISLSVDAASCLVVSLTAQNL